LYVYGTANNTTINSGYLGVYEGGTANDTTVNGGLLFVYGTANNTSINDGSLSVSGTANDTTINSGSLSVFGTANNTTINDGELYVDKGRTANDTFVNGGKISSDKGIIDGLTINENGSFSFSTDTTLTNATIYGKDVSIVDHVANGFVLNNDSYLSVYSDGTVNYTTVNGGELYLSNGAVADNTILKNGTISNDGNLEEIILDINGGSGNIDNSNEIKEITGKVHNGDFYFYQNGVATLKNVSFKNNNMTMYGDFNIVADNGISEFRGNTKLLYSEENSTPKQESYFTNNLSIVAQNNGEIVFDDVIGSSARGSFMALVSENELLVDEEQQKVISEYSYTSSEDEYLSTIAFIEADFPDAEWNEDKTEVNITYMGMNMGYKFDKQSDGNYLITESMSQNFEIKDGDYWLNSGVYEDETVYSFAEMQDLKNEMNSWGGTWLDENTLLSMVSADGMNVSYTYKIKPQEGETYRLETSIDYIFQGSDIDIDGDASGEVYFNEQVFAKNVTLQNTNVFFGKNSRIKDYTFNAISGSVNNAIIGSGGKLVLEAAAKAKDTVVELGGKLVAEAAAIIENITAKAQSILEIDQDTTLKGNIVIDKEADISGSTYDFSKIFSNANLDVESLTVTGGVHEAFTNTLVNETTQDKGLTLEGGEYSLANVIKEGSTQVAGWDVINIKATESAPATIVKLETDIELVGSNREMIIGEKATLDVSGHSPLEITIDGNVTNSGTMDFTIYDNDGEADDIITIAGDYKAAPGALIVLNVEPEKDKADKLIVQGDVIGNTNVYLKSNSEAEPTAAIVFAEVPNDDEATSSNFEVTNVEGSPFAWDTKKQDNKWYAYIDGLLPPTSGEEGKPDTSKIRKLTGEMIAYMGLYDAGFEQTAGLSRNALNNTVEAKYCKHAWVTPIHQNLEIDAPYKYEAKISGLDAGIDINSDGINKWGVLASYRKGNYEFDGQGDKYYSEYGSEIDIDSYAMGLYFRRDKYNSKFAGTIYAGMQKAEISSDDGAKAKTDALEIGASLDVSHIFEVAKDVTIAPELQISYQMLDYDNIKDNAGKKVQLEAAHRITAEAGAKLEKKWTLDEGKAAIYVKPSVIQTIHGGGKLNVKALDSIHTTEDRTLGRFEIGAEYEVNTRWSVGASAAHTFGSDYKDTTFSLDAKYRF
ncbi:MAG: autotransporter outer membrane beta-barrel domain-containing protein, partial [Alphaproteobacteria bacterium]|nr:autotransporter outer membrane beta-barrel domain-containing protein [Alphaproteobacteria bacterium]